jgi:ABC-type branched-subunit amino acid transport system ATPase component
VSAASPDGAQSATASARGALRVERVSKHFGGVQALKSVSLDAPPGSVTGLIGPNGSGKSTLFNVVTGVLPMDSGEIYAGDRRVDARRPDLVARQGIVRTFQVPRVAKEITVLENLLFGPMVQRGEGLWALFNPLASGREEEQRRLERAVAELDLLNLRHLANEYAGNLSGGQLKLLSLGMALMADPQVMLLDEPTAGVNPVLIRRLMGTLDALRGRGHTLLIIEHNMQVIAELCHTVCVLDAGEIIARGSPDEVRRDPRVVAAYLGTSAELSR